jgi:hypothetical protein
MNCSSHRIDSMSRWLVPAAGQGAAVAVDPVVVEAQAVQDLAGAGLQLVAAELLVLVLHLAEAGQDGFHLVHALRIAQGRLQILQLVVQFADPAAAGDGLVQHRAAGHVADVLPEVADGRAPGHGHRALVGLLLAGDQAEHRGLARAVGTDQAHLLARVELEGCLDEQDLPAVALGDVGQVDHAGTPSVSGWRSGARTPVPQAPGTAI